MVERFWAHEARTPENFFGYQVGLSVVRRMRRHLLPARRIADYGAGAGFLVDDLLANGYAVGAIEFGPAAVRALTAKFATRAGFLGAWEVNEVVATAAERFDAIFLTEVVEHLYDSELLPCLHNIRALLREEGLLIITTPNAEDLSKSMMTSPESGRLFHRWQHVRSWTGETLASAVSAQGFEVIEVAATDFAAYPAALHRTHSMPIRWLRAGSKQVFNLFRRRLPPHLYLVARASTA